MKSNFFGQIAMEKGFINEDQLDRALKEQEVSGNYISRELLNLGAMSEKQISEVLSEQFDLPVIDLDTVEVDEDALSSVPPHVIKNRKIIPYEIDKSVLKVATCDPMDLPAIQDVEFCSGKRVKLALAPRDSILRAVKKYCSQELIFSDLMTNVKEQSRLEVITYEEGEDEEGNLSEKARAKPITKLVSYLLSEALEKRASDIHVEAMPDFVKVRYRIDGKLINALELPLRLHSQLISRLKIMGGADIAERRVPQDGRCGVVSESRSVDLRLSFLPTIQGEKAVIRILDKNTGFLKLENLGFSDELLLRFKLLLSKPQGVILLTGPTGSGKTTSLYSALKYLKREEVNIVTIEDPVEYELEGINQVPLNEKAGMTFAKALRSILRQDPDIILVGEIRDEQTLETAFRSAQTGHLILSTIHTNDTASTITRLVDMGSPPYMIASSVKGIVATRLLRKICRCCKIPMPREGKSMISEDFLKDKELYVGKGCPECDFTGYHGRTGVQEVLLIDDRIKRMISDHADESDIKEVAREIGDFKELQEDGLEKLLQGIIGYEDWKILPRSQVPGLNE